MSGRFVLDTNVVWYGFKNASYKERLEAVYRPLHLSSVALTELSSHADAIGRAQIDQARETAVRAKRVFAPTVRDWHMAGAFLFDQRPRTIGRVPAEERLRIARMQNDALIALSTWNRGWTIVTCDGHDFTRLERYFPEFKGRLIIEPAPAG